MLYDLCIITFAKADVDARSLNFVRTCSESGMRILYIALKPDSEPELSGSVDHKYISVDQNRRMIVQWQDFLKNVKPHLKNIKPANVVFSDLYSLPLIKSFKDRARFIYDSREIYSALGPLAGSKVKQKIISFIEKRFVQYVDEFIVSGELDEEYLKEHFKTKKPFHVILNLPPYKKPKNKNLIREIYKIPDDKFVMLYQGALVPGRGLLKAINAMTDIPDTVLVITGEGPHIKALTDHTDKNNLKDKVIFSGKISYDRLHDWTCSCDAGVVLFEPVSLSYKYSLPNKLFEIFMAGKPVITTDLPAINKVLKKYPAGKMIPPKLNEQDIVQAVLYLQSEKNRSAMQEESKKAAHEFNYEAQADKIIKILRR